MNDEDIRHLNLLSTFHYVVAGLIAFSSCIQILAGYGVVSGWLIPTDAAATLPPFFTWTFMTVLTVATLIGWATAACVIIAGSRLRKRTARVFCMVIAAIECTFTPIGTVLGVFTLIVLSRDSVKQIFAQQPANGAL